MSLVSCSHFWVVGGTLWSNIVQSMAIFAAETPHLVDRPSVDNHNYEQNLTRGHFSGT